MKKDSMIKILVVIVVLAFAFEGISIYGASNQGEQAPGGQGSQKVYIGTIVSELFFEGYEPSITAVGNSSLEEVAKKLKEQGIATYFVKPKDEIIIVNLRSPSDVQATAGMFEEVNATAFSRGFFSMNELVNATVDGVGVVQASGTRIRDDIKPIFEKGDFAKGQFSARLEGIDGGLFVITGTGAVSFIPDLLEDVRAEAEIIGILTRAYEFEIDWENRAIDRALLEAEFPEFEYTPLSYIIPKEEITPDRQKEFSENGLGYLSAISSKTISVAANFTESSKAREDFAPYGLEFPKSALKITVANESKEEIESMVFGIFGKNYTPMPYSGIVLNLPKEIMHANKTYRARESETNAYFEGEYEIGEKLEVVLGTTAIGSEIFSIESVQKAE